MPTLKSFAFGLYKTFASSSSSAAMHRASAEAAWPRHHRPRRRCRQRRLCPAAAAVGVGGGGATDVGGATLPSGPEFGHCLALADGCPVVPPHSSEY
jgi:hypothetical protein